MKEMKGQTAQYYYFDMINGEFIELDDYDRLLAPFASTKLIKVPRFVVLLTAPLAGLAFVVLVPALCLTSLIRLVGEKIKSVATVYTRTFKTGY